MGRDWRCLFFLYITNTHIPNMSMIDKNTIDISKMRRINTSSNEERLTTGSNRGNERKVITPVGTFQHSMHFVPLDLMH